MKSCGRIGRLDCAPFLSSMRPIASARLLVSQLAGDAGLLDVDVTGGAFVSDVRTQSRGGSGHDHGVPLAKNAGRREGAQGGALLETAPEFVVRYEHRPDHRSDAWVTLH